MKKHICAFVSLWFIFCAIARNNRRGNRRPIIRSVRRGNPQERAKSLGEVVIICVEGEWKGWEGKHNREELHELIDIWSGLRISFLHPNEAVATTCYNLYNHSKYKDSRIKPADLVHLGYALAYDVDFFITTDRILRGYSIPKEFKTKVLHPREAQAILK